MTIIMGMCGHWATFWAGCGSIQGFQFFSARSGVIAGEKSFLFCMVGFYQRLPQLDLRAIMGVCKHWDTFWGQFRDFSFFLARSGVI